jgi:hypothetical protein
MIHVNRKKNDVDLETDSASPFTSITIEYDIDMSPLVYDRNNSYSCVLPGLDGGLKYSSYGKI